MECLDLRLEEFGIIVPDVYFASSIADFLNGDIEVPTKIRIKSPFTAIQEGEGVEFIDFAYIIFENSPCLQYSEGGILMYDTTGRIDITPPQFETRDKDFSGRYDLVSTTYYPKEDRLVLVNGRMADHEPAETTLRRLKAAFNN